MIFDFLKNIIVLTNKDIRKDKRSVIEQTITFLILVFFIMSSSSFKNLSSTMIVSALESFKATLESNSEEDPSEISEEDLETEDGLETRSTE